MKPENRRQEQKRLFDEASGFVTGSAMPPGEGFPAYRGGSAFGDDNYTEFPI